MSGPAAWLAGLLVALAGVGGCSTQPVPLPASGDWHVAAALARAADPEVAATRAARAARRQLGNAPADGVVFFDCFRGVRSPQRVAAAVASVFQQAEIVGCSTAGLATRDAVADDRAVAVLAVSGAGCRFASAHVPASAGSAEAMSRELAQRLGARAGHCAIILLAAPAGPEQAGLTTGSDGRDPNALLAGLLGPPIATEGDGGPLAEAGRRTILFGGLAGRRAQRGAVRLYHRQRAHADGAVALQISGPLNHATGTDHELLRVGPTWRVHRVKGLAIGQLSAGGETLSADVAIGRFLNAQERGDGHVGRLIGNHVVPLHFTEADAGTVRLPTRLTPGERLVLLRSGPAEGRAQAVRRALGRAAMPRGMNDGRPMTLLALPAGANDRYADELGRVRQELARSAPAPRFGILPKRGPIGPGSAQGRAEPGPAIAFLCPAQFATVGAGPPLRHPAETGANWPRFGPGMGRAGGRHQTCQLHQHTVAVFQVGRRFGTLPAPPTTAPED